MSNGFVKLIRGNGIQWIVKTNHHAAVLLLVIAIRAKREHDETDNLEIGEAMIGDYENYSMTRQNYRSTIKWLKSNQLVTTRATNRGTVAKLIDTSIFDINISDANQPKFQSQPSESEKATTNKKYIKKEEIKTTPLPPIGVFDSQRELLLEEARTVIKHFNVKYGKDNPLDSRDTGIVAAMNLLRGGRTKEELISVIDKKAKDPKLDVVFFRPETLFSQDKFPKYLKENESDYGKKMGDTPTKPETRLLPDGREVSIQEWIKCSVTDKAGQ